MELKKAKEHSAKILKVGVGRIHISEEGSEKVKDAMTKMDVRQLIAERIIKKRGPNHQSKSKARKLKEKRKKGRKKGKGKRKGTLKARTEGKRKWIKNVRAQRRQLKELKKNNPEAVKEKGYRLIYKKIKGNFFKGKKYVKNYIEGEE